MRLDKRIYLIFGILLIVLPTLAQENSDYKNRIIQENSIRDNYAIKGSEYVLELNKNIFFITNTSDIQIPHISFDYKKDSGIPLSKRLLIYLESDRRLYQSMSSYTSMYGALEWKINELISIRGGLLAVKQFSGIKSFGTDRSGIQFNLNYKLDEKVKFNIWGQYLSKYDSNEPKFSDLLMPQTSTGASATLKISKNSEIGVTTQYQVINQANKASYESKGKFKLNF